MKKTNENLVILITLFAISIVIANVTGARTITTGLHIGPIELALSGGAITYAELDFRHRQSVRIPRFPVVGCGRVPCNP